MSITLTDEQEKTLEEVIIYIRLCKKAYEENSIVFKEVWAQQNLEQNTIKRIENILGIPLNDKETDNAIWTEANKRFEKLIEDTYAKSLGEQHKNIVNDLKKLFPLSREEALAFGKGVAAVGLGYLLFKGVSALTKEKENKKDTGE